MLRPAQKLEVSHAKGGEINEWIGPNRFTVLPEAYFGRVSDAPPEWSLPSPSCEIVYR